MLWKDLQSKVIKQYSFFPSLCSLPPPSVLAFLDWWVFFLLLQSLFNFISRIIFQRTKGGQATELCLFSNNVAPNISIRNESQLGQKFNQFGNIWSSEYLPSFYIQLPAGEFFPPTNILNAKTREDQREVYQYVLL